MNIFLDLGTNEFQGLKEFTLKKNLNKSTIVYCYEANSYTYNNSLLEKKNIEINYKELNHFNKAIMDYNGSILFNSHHGAYENGNYNPEYTGGSNALEINPNVDPGNGVIFDIHPETVECIDITDLLKKFNDEFPDTDIFIKCDIEGSEFKVLDKLLKMETKFLKNIKEIYIEWHERFFENTDKYTEICNLKADILQKLNDLNIVYYEHH